MNDLDEKIITWKFSCLNLASQNFSLPYDEDDEDEGVDVVEDAVKIIASAEKYYEFITKGLELSKSNNEPPF